MGLALRKVEAKRALVVGLGLTGLSCVRHLVARGYDVSAIDSRSSPPQLDDLRREFPDVPTHTGGFPADWLDRADLLVVSPGVSLREPAVARAIAAGREAIGDIELFARAARAKVAAVTGSNGKSTVTALLGAMCRAGGLDTRVGGNIGVPALALLEAREPDVYVLELSSFQLETTSSLNARAATVLNLAPDHMDRYRDLAEYTDAKARIFNGDGVMVLNADDVRVRNMARPGRRTLRFTLGAPAAAAEFGLRVQRGGELWLARGDRDLMPARDLRLPGRHNIANVLAAMALADALGIALAAQASAARAFTGLPHRTELVAERNGVRWINDSKGTNVGATVAALSGMDAPVVLIAGGDGKGADFSELRAACTNRARVVIVIGRDGPRIEAALAGAVSTTRATTLSDAVRQAAAVAQPGDVVLLSPACASFDMFRDYRHRGEVFRAAVREQLS
jgi:UDP-N-acetylmuramoylalanine--D-glutamate ligase